MDCDYFQCLQLFSRNMELFHYHVKISFIEHYGNSKIHFKDYQMKQAGTMKEAHLYYDQ